MEMVVVLPAPLWPSSTKIWPSYMCMSMLSTATLTPSGVLNSLRSLLTPTKRPSRSLASSEASGCSM